MFLHACRVLARYGPSEHPFLNAEKLSEPNLLKSKLLPKHVAVFSSH